MSDPKRDLLRHTVATLAYRGGKAVRDAPPAFAAFRAGETTRTPAQILAHICDLVEWAAALARGEKTWNDRPPQTWEADVQRFFDALQKLEGFLASDAPLGNEAERLFQGPIADALTHVGQIAMLRRMAGSPMRGENYFRAEIAAGRVGRDQVPPKRAFD